MMMRPFGGFLQHLPLCEHEMEGDDPFRSVMLRARVCGTVEQQSDMLEL